METLKRPLIRIASKLYNTPLAKFPAYMSKGHANYLGFILSLVNFIVIFQGIVLNKFNLDPFSKLVVSVLTILSLIAVTLVLGWMDLHALSTRKSDEELIYWRRPVWKHIANLTYRYNPLSMVTFRYEYAEKKIRDEEVKKRIENCLRTIAQNTIDWCYSSREVNVQIPPFLKECLRDISLYVDGIEIDEDLLNRLEATNKKRLYR